jgi:hypothetical protein
VPALAVSNAADALTAARDVAVIVTAIRLRGTTDGVGLILQLRRDERTKDIPIVVLTACGFSRSASAASKREPTYFWRSPTCPTLSYTTCGDWLHLGAEAGGAWEPFARSRGDKESSGRPLPPARMAG